MTKERIMPANTKNGTAAAKRVFVVDDHPIVRKGLAAQFADETDLVLCGEAEDVVDATARIPDAKPDLVIIDISLKNSNGIDLVKRLKAKSPSMQILIWSMFPEALYAERALSAGANGYVNKGSSAKQFMEAVRAVLDGKIYVSAEMSEKILGRLTGGKKEQGATYIEKLTDRELQAFEYLGQGLTTSEIAIKMHVSPKTIDTYRARIKEKLCLANATELMQHAVRWSMGAGDSNE
jgi:DNA-binding NarL/FixJ family response regulator